MQRGHGVGGIQDETGRSLTGVLQLRVLSDDLDDMIHMLIFSQLIALFSLKSYGVMH